MNLKNCVYISWKIQILTKLQHKITQIFTKKYYLPSKFSKLHNLEAHFCELLRPRAPPFQKIKWNPWNLVTTLQKSCFLGPTIFEILQPNWYYCTIDILPDQPGRKQMFWKSSNRTVFARTLVVRNKRGGGAKVAKSLKVEGGIFWKKTST